MSDSLRDQLLKAGFDEPKVKSRPKPKPKNRSGRKPPGNANQHSAGKQAAAGAAGSAQSGPGQSAKESQSAAGQSAAAGAAQTTPKSNAPLAGYTHVKALPAKKKKKQKAPAIKPRASSWGTKDHSASEQASKTPHDSGRSQEHKQKKEAIQKLIESTAVKDFKGEEIYRFTIKNKIRELLVSEAVRKRLAGGELAITRLNGAILIVPSETAVSIREINPQWVIFIASDAPDSTDDDEEFPVPDDLVW